VHNILNYKFGYVQLPNNIILKLSPTDTNKFAILDKNKRIIVEPNVIDVLWNDDYVAGAIMKDGLISNFVYKLEEKEQYIFENSTEYYLKLDEIGIKQSIETVSNSPHVRKFTSLDKTYYDLKNEAKYRRSWYE